MSIKKAYRRIEERMHEQFQKGSSIEHVKGYPFQEALEILEEECPEVKETLINENILNSEDRRMRLVLKENRKWTLLDKDNNCICEFGIGSKVKITVPNSNSFYSFYNHEGIVYSVENNNLGFVVNIQESFGICQILLTDIISMETIRPTISKKTEKKMKRVPFDLSKKEDRETLRGRWIADKETLQEEYMITAINNNSVVISGEDICGSLGCVVSDENLLEHFIFLDKKDAGEPVGKLIGIK